MTRKTTIIILVLIAASGVLLIGIAMRYGIGITPDSIYYIGGARSLLSGVGFRHPLGDLITHYPPFYSSVLYALAIFGPDPIVIGRWLNMALFAANILLTGMLLYVLLDKKFPSARWLSLIGAVFVATSAGMIEIHSMAWSEPLYIFLQMLGLVLLAYYFQKGGILSLLLSGLIIGFALVTRYAGVAIIGAGLLGILLVSSNSFWRKIKISVYFGIASSLPMILWMIRNWILSGTTTNRELIIHAFNRAHITETLTTFSSWLLVPEGYSWPIKIFSVSLVIALLAVAAVIWLRGMHADWKLQIRTSIIEFPAVLWLLIFLIPIYMGVLIVTNTFLNTYTPMDRRILSPIYIPTVIIILYFFGYFYQQIQLKRMSRVLFAGLMIGFMCLHIFVGYQNIASAYNNGLGFNGREWSDSELLKVVRQQPSEISIYSNAPEAIYIQTNRPANKIPETTRIADNTANEDYQQEVEGLDAKITTGPVALVIFDLPWRTTQETYDDLLAALPIQNSRSVSDGTIYYLAYNP